MYQAPMLAEHRIVVPGPLADELLQRTYLPLGLWADPEQA